jgi:hypothetical protein
MRIVTTVALDPEVFQTARKHFKNLSATVNEMLRLAVEVKDPDNKELFDLVKMKEKLRQENKDLEVEIRRKKRESKEKKRNEQETYIPEAVKHPSLARIDKDPRIPKTH